MKYAKTHTSKEYAYYAVNESIENPVLSIRRRSQQLELCPSTTWKILQKDLGLHPYMTLLAQKLKARDQPFRRSFGDWTSEQL